MHVNRDGFHNTVHSLPYAWKPYAWKTLGKLGTLNTRNTCKEN